MGQGFASRDHLAVVQEHEIDITVGIQFGPAVTPDCNQSQRRKFLLRLLG